MEINEKSSFMAMYWTHKACSLPLHLRYKDNKGNDRTNPLQIKRKRTISCDHLAP